MIVLNLQLNRIYGFDDFEISFTYPKKVVNAIIDVSASEILKRNTDSIRNAVENDVFGSLPDDFLLDEVEMG